MNKPSRKPSRKPRGQSQPVLVLQIGLVVLQLGLALIEIVDMVTSLLSHL